MKLSVPGLQRKYSGISRVPKAKPASIQLSGSDLSGIRFKMKSLRIVARESPLSLLQVEEAWPRLASVLSEGASYELIPVSTIGDTDQKTPLTDASVPQDYFTRELDQALLDGQADLAVHSAKDLPDPMPETLIVAAKFPARDIRDALVRNKNLPADQPPRVIGTSSPRREAWIRYHWPDAEVKPIRGTIGSRIKQVDSGDYDAVIIAACALDRLGWSDRISEYLDLESEPDQARLAVTIRADRADLLQPLRRIDVRRTAGLVALVGCPAELSLMPLRAQRYLEEADVIYADRLLPHGVLDRFDDKTIPVGKTGHSKSITQIEIHRRILHDAEAGKLVVRLQGGDPGIFGHLGETLNFLADWEIRADVIPAVTAAQITAAHARAPLTHRHEGRSVRFISGHTAEGYNEGDWPAPEHGSLALYMGVREREQIARRLIESGWPPETEVTVGEQLGDHSERILTTSLRELGRLELNRPATLLVGPRRFPQLGYTLFTGTNPERFLRQGPLLHMPLIRLVPLPKAERAEFLARELETFDGVIFPSRVAVRYFIEPLLQAMDVRALGGKAVLAVGPSTEAALRESGLRADAAPRNFGGAGALAEALGNRFRGRRFLYPCSSASPVDQRVAAMAEAGIKLVPETFYTNESIPWAHLPHLPFHRVLFTSGSTVQAYFDQFPAEKSSQRTWLAVGTSTLKALDKLGIDGELMS